MQVARTLAKKKAVEVTLIDKKNHHTFQPLLYQVATTVLSPNEIAFPLRRVFSRADHVDIIMAEVDDLNLDERKVLLLGARSLSYDYLVVAAGSRHSYFGHNEWEKHAPGLKTVEDAIGIRHRILVAFEKAESKARLERQDKPKPLHFAVIGGGPTGVELAGAMRDIATKALARDFNFIDPQQTQVTLYEGARSILGAFPQKLSRKAEAQLWELGVRVRKETLVTDVQSGRIKAGGEWVEHEVILWATGVSVSPLAKKLGVATDRAGRVPVGKDLSLPGRPEVFVVGDMAALKDENGQVVPALASAAMQEGVFVAKAILRERAGRERGSFRYKDYGSMATIGRHRAVALIGRLQLSGATAWLMWALVHVLMLIGFRSRMAVFFEWTWAYFTRERSARLIMDYRSDTMEE